MKACKALLVSETKLMIRDGNSLFFGVGFAVVLTMIFGLVMGGKPAYEGASFTLFDQSYGGLAAIGLAATGLMGMPLVLADYRHRYILRRYMVTPASPALLLGVQLVIHVAVSLLSLVAVTLTATLFGFHMRGSVLRFLLAYGLVLVSVFSLGLVIASLCPSVKSAELWTSLLYFPMLLLSGATLPYEILPLPLQLLSDMLPLTQGIKLLKNASLGLPSPDARLPIVLLAAITVVCVAVSLRKFRWVPGTR